MTGEDERPRVFGGRAWAITGPEGELMDDIDTDMIFHNAHLHITDIAEMGQHTFGNLKGYTDFAERAGEGDMVFAGENFGAGSSRQQAVDCFRSLGITCLVCRSYGAIYKRNAINSGFPILVLGELDLGPEDMGGDGPMERIEVDMDRAEIRKGGVVVGRLEPPSDVQMDIYEAGDIFEFAKRL